MNRSEKSGEGAAGANGFGKQALAKYHRFTVAEVRGHDGQRDRQFFEQANAERAIDHRGHAFIVGEAKAGSVPAGKIAKMNFPAGGDDFTQWSATGVSGAQSAADTASGNAGQGNVLLLEDAQDTELREGSSKAATKSQADAGTKRGAIGKERGRMVEARHDSIVMVMAGNEHRPHVLNVRYQSTRGNTGGKWIIWA